MIDDYSFGSIVINGEKYDHDVEVRWDGEVLSWWREDGHIFDIPDLERALNRGPDVVVLGAGNDGMVKITKSLRDRLDYEGIEVVEGKTQDVVGDFNELLEDGFKKVIGLFHITC